MKAHPLCGVVGEIELVGSPLTRPGTEIPEQDYLEIRYRDEEGNDRVVIIEYNDLRSLIRSRRGLPVPVRRRQRRPDGAETSQRVGACDRSFSGDHLLIAVVGTGKMRVCWKAFLSAVRRTRRTAPVITV